MGIHPNFDSTWSTADVGMIFALWSEYSAYRKRRGDPLRRAVRSPNRVFIEALSARMPDGPAPAPDPVLYLKPSVLH